MKEQYYWPITIAVAVAAAAAGLLELIPIYNLVVFVLGFVWCWVGVTHLLDLPIPDGGFFADWRGGKPLGLALLGLGIAWVAVSLTALSLKNAVVGLVSLPFVVALFVIKK